MLRAWPPALAALGVVCAIAAPAGESRPAASPAELLARYEPLVYEYSSDWNPIRVEPYLAAADLERRGLTRWQLVRRSPPATALGAGSSSFRLDLRSCTPAVDLDSCYATRAPRGHPAVYGRVWTGPSSGPIGAVIQYWLFYPLNDWRNRLSQPSIWQLHEGDWEAVCVALSRGGTPVSVAASQHELGVVRPWSRVAKVAATHPVVYAALGSHANYLSVGYRGAAGRPHRIPPPFSGVPLVEPDFTARQTSYGPAGLARNALEVVDITAGSPWLRFAGAWGDGAFVLAGTRTASGGYSFGHLRVGSSPPGPAFHRAWIDPLSPFAWPADDGH